MAFPSPTEKQGRILWISLTALGVGILLALLGVLLWGFGWLLQQLSSVLLPLAIAGIIAYLLDPVVDFLERKKMRRTGAILLVFFLGVLLVLIFLALVVPRLVIEIRDLIEQVPAYSASLHEKIKIWLESQPLAAKAKAAWASDLGETVKDWVAKVVPIISAWLFVQITRVASWAGLLVGLALIPVYAFYLLLEKTGIQRSWTDYLPIHESRIKHEVVFVITAINDYLILFFRGQVLVAFCDGALYTIGFLSIGLNYAFLLGGIAGLLSVVPFLGFVISLVPALVLAAVQRGDWLHPAMVLGVFGLVQLLEGLVISPKIMGERVGLHPLTIIIAVMVGTTLMGGIIGGILAIPLTAALRVLMFRYVWKRGGGPERDGSVLTKRKPSNAVLK